MNLTILNYSLNKFCPWLIVGFLLFYNFGYMKMEPYIILGLMFFMERFNYKIGYSVAYCECNNIDLSKNPDESL